MRDRHLTPEVLQKVLAGDDQAESWLLLHHLAVCPTCYSVGGYILKLFEAGAIDLGFCDLDIDLATKDLLRPPPGAPESDPPLRS